MTDFNHIAEASRASIEKEDLKILLPLVAQIAPKNILEIGMDKGFSMEIWRRAFNPNRLVGLDINNYPKPMTNFFTMPESLYETDSHTEEARRKVLRRFSAIDFLFIDGDHSLTGVKQDFDMYSPLVKKGGIIAFHDACYHADGTEEVDIFWQEIKNQYPYVEIKASKQSTGMGVIWV